MVLKDFIKQFMVIQKVKEKYFELAPFRTNDAYSLNSIYFVSQCKIHERDRINLIHLMIIMKLFGVV